MIIVETEPVAPSTPRDQYFTLETVFPNYPKSATPQNFPELKPPRRFPVSPGLGADIDRWRALRETGKLRSPGARKFNRNRGTGKFTARHLFQGLRIRYRTRYTASELLFMIHYGARRRQFNFLKRTRISIRLMEMLSVQVWSVYVHVGSVRGNKVSDSGIMS